MIRKTDSRDSRVLWAVSRSTLSATYQHVVRNKSLTFGRNLSLTRYSESLLHISSCVFKAEPQGAHRPALNLCVSARSLFWLAGDTHEECTGMCRTGGWLWFQSKTTISMICVIPVCPRNHRAQRCSSVKLVFSFNIQFRGMLYLRACI